jgi:hypothetical protein
VDVNSVANVSEVHAVSIFGLEVGKDGVHVCTVFAQLTHGARSGVVPYLGQ